MRILLLTTILFIISTSVSAQKYEMIDTATFSKRKALKVYYEARHKEFNTKLKTETKGKKRKELLIVYETNQKEFIKNIENNLYFYNEQIDEFVNSILKEITEKNPSLQDQKLKILISKNPGPNAMCIGDGTFIINMGLFRFLENEHQFASVLCHELGHQLLNHVNQSINEYVDRNLSQELITKSRTIKKQQYNQKERAFEELKMIVYNDSDRNRKHEISADSIGYKLYSNTSFVKGEFINALKILKETEDHQEELNNFIFLDQKDYISFFDLPNQPFKETWLNKEDFSDYNYDLYKQKIDKDSVRSHPQLIIRINTLKETFPELKTITQEIKKPSNAYKKLERIAVYEQIPSLYDMEEYGASLYTALKMYKDRSDDLFIREWIGINFEKLYTAKKEYRFNRYVDQLIPKEQSNSYFQFLNFMWNLNLNEIKTIANHYTEKGSK